MGAWLDRLKIADGRCTGGGGGGGGAEDPNPRPLPLLPSLLCFSNRGRIQLHTKTLVSDPQKLACSD